ncbi:MAG: alanine--tRNA ligase [Candidatus Micrarchaeota archaeon]
MFLSWTARKLREKFLSFFEEKGHAIIPSASLVPENDSTVLFTTAGMHPLVPFLLGQPHPAGKRLVNVQKCLRTDDIDEVGDAFHHTFFEMLGNWSLGDYFKREAIEWSYEFLTDKRWLGLDARRLSVTVFAGDEDAPRDDESAQAWRSLGIPGDKIFFLPKKDNWWGPAGATGPCGPDTEMFFDSGAPKCSEKCKPGCGCGKYFEVWNDVFIQYDKRADGVFGKLAQRNVDTGMGVERTLAMLTSKKNDYETELFEPIMKEIDSLGSSGKTMNAASATVSKRIVADHLRAACFILAENGRVVPSNVEQGYVLRRLIRRGIRHGRLLGINKNFCGDIAGIVVQTMGADWPELEKNREFIISELGKEEARFTQVLGKGVRSFERLVEQNKAVSAKDAFLLYQSFGFPLEMTIELAKEKGISIDKRAFEKEFERHQALSRKGAEQKFRSGLADESAETTALHTATHLLHAALRRVLGSRVQQKGSNITKERLRFDFSFDRKMTSEELKKAEALVNEAIDAKLPVERREESLDEARKEGALAFFDEKYAPERVSVYAVGSFSKEVCTGPHARNTGELARFGRFRILKEEAVSAGVRRIKAVLTTEK